MVLNSQRNVTTDQHDDHQSPRTQEDDVVPGGKPQIMETNLKDPRPNHLSRTFADEECATYPTSPGRSFRQTPAALRSNLPRARSNTRNGAVLQVPLDA